MEYTAVGQSTHLAARMEQLASPGTTLMSAATLSLVEDFVVVKPHGATPIRGLSEPVEVYELVSCERGTLATPGHRRTRIDHVCRSQC
jgi:class 3 adenylate cyclase